MLIYLDMLTSADGAVTSLRCRGALDDDGGEELEAQARRTGARVVDVRGVRFATAGGVRAILRTATLTPDALVVVAEPGTAVWRILDALASRERVRLVAGIRESSVSVRQDGHNEAAAVS